MKKCSNQAGDVNISRYRDRAAELKELSILKAYIIPKNHTYYLTRSRHTSF